MPRLEETIRVPRSRAECFRYVADFSTTEQWDPGVYRARKLTAGSPGPGTEFEVIVSSGWRRLPMRYRLEELIRDERLVLTGRADSLTARDVIEFRAVDASHTEIRYRADLEFSGAMKRFEPWLGPWLRRVGRQAVGGLSRALTAKTTLSEVTPLRKLCDNLVITSLPSFTERGYLKIRDKGLSEFIDDQVVVLTGPTSGLGLAAASALARLGARLILVGRTPSKLRDAMAAIRNASGCGEGALSCVEADLSRIEEVERAAQEIRAQTEAVDVLINNAGALFDHRGETSDGHERTLAINLIAPYILTRELLEPLARGKGRVINVSSGGMYAQGLRLDDLQYTTSRYDGPTAYARAKRGLVAITDHFAETVDPHEVTFNSMHPGWADTPGVKTSLPRFHRLLEKRLRDPRMGADTIVWLATSAEVEGSTGQFYFDRRPRPKVAIPKTQVSAAQRDSLVKWLDGLAPDASRGDERRGADAPPP